MVKKYRGIKKENERDRIFKSFENDRDNSCVIEIDHQPFNCVKKRSKIEIKGDFLENFAEGPFYISHIFLSRVSDF